MDGRAADGSEALDFLEDWTSDSESSDESSVSSESVVDLKTLAKVRRLGASFGLGVMTGLTSGGAKYAISVDIVVCMDLVAGLVAAVWYWVEWSESSNVLEKTSTATGVVGAETCSSRRLLKESSDLVRWMCSVPRCL